MILLSHWSAARLWNIPYATSYFRQLFTNHNFYTVTTKEEKYLVGPENCEVCKILPAEGSAASLWGHHVVSVEHLFLQLCHLLGDALPSILMGCLLCSRGPNGEPPLTTVEKLSEYALKANYINGRPRALYALTYIKNGFESPMEILVYMTFSLPCRLGGLGFTDLNLVSCVIAITQEEADELGQKSLYLKVDLCDEIHKRIVEYDGVLYHSTPAQKEHDEIRRKILRKYGYVVHVITRDVLADYAQIGTICDNMADDINRRVRIRTPKFEPYFRYIRSLCPRPIEDGPDVMTLWEFLRSLKIRVRRL